MIPQKTIQRITEAANILDVVRDFEPRLRKKGQNWECLCPFHADKHVGSFSINERRNMCYCFSCEKGGDAIYYLMEGQGMTYPAAVAYLGKKYGIEVEGSEAFKDVKPCKPRERQDIVRLPVLEFPMSMYQRTTRNLEQDTLVRWLYNHKWDDIQAGRIANVLRDYHVGTAQDGSGFTIFWMLDEFERLCTGKMLKYKYDGHRFKNDELKYNSDWIHARLFKSPKFPQYDRELQDWKRTYFGTHLINMYPDAEVRIVESEKTALTMAIAYGNHAKQIWLACGSKVYLTHERLKPLMDRGRRIVLYPDRDGVDEWTMTCQAIGYRDMVVNAQPVTEWWQEGDGDHADIADVVLRMIDSHDKPAARLVKEFTEKYHFIKDE